MRTLILLICLSLVSATAYAANSMVTPAGVAEMVKAGVDKEIIAYVVTHQTCSYGTGDVIALKRSGAPKDVILAAVEADRCDGVEASTALQEAKLVETLKAAGMSDEAVLQFLDSARSVRRVDPDGRSYIEFGTGGRREPRPVEGAVLPQVQLPSLTLDKDVDDKTGEDSQ